jgi:hypothetical protein
MFDVDRQIHEWRQDQAESLGERPEVLDELEGHLRDEVQRQLHAGQAPEAAWTAALARLGDPRHLAAEFAKVPPAPARWLPARVVLVAEGVAAVGAALLVLTAFWQGRMGPLVAAHVFTITVGYVATFAVGTLAVWSILTRAVRGWDTRRATALRSAGWRLSVAGMALTAVGVALGAWWARDNLGRWWGWDLREVGGMSVLVWYGAMLAALWRSTGGGRLAMFLGTIGNIVVSLSWFGPALAEGTHSYGTVPWPGLMLLAGFTVSQTVILALMLVPTGRLAWRRG